MSSGVIGSTIGAYRIESELGRGGMAVVYCAAPLRGGPPVALKLLAAHLSEDDRDGGDFVRRFERETEVVQGLSHPAIVPILDSGRYDGRPYLVMPLLGGGTLADRLAGGPLPPAQIVAVLARVGGALDTAHAQRLVHRDVKPSNILFDAAGAAYLADFGIVKVLNTSRKFTPTSTSLGTPEYMSPEQFGPDAPDGLTGRSDLYALGVVLFEMLTGRPPFRAANTWAIVLQHFNDLPPRLRALDPSLPAGWQPVLDRALAKKPAARYPTGAALALAAAAVTATPPPRAPAAPRRVLAALGGAALLVALVALLVVPGLPPRRPALPTAAAVAALSPTTLPAAGLPALTSTPAATVGTLMAVIAPVDTPTGTATPSPTAGPPGARLLVSAALRAGPGANFDLLAELPAEAVALILGRDESWGWYNVRLADGRAGWLPRTAVSLLDPAAMALIPPAATLPVLPTATTAATATFLPPATAPLAPAATVFVAAPTAAPPQAIATQPVAAEPPTARPPRNPTAVQPTAMQATVIPPTEIPPTLAIPPTVYP